MRLFGDQFQAIDTGDGFQDIVFMDSTDEQCQSPTLYGDEYISFSSSMTKRMVGDHSYFITFILDDMTDRNYLIGSKFDIGPKCYVEPDGTFKFEGGTTISTASEYSATPILPGVIYTLGLVCRRPKTNTIYPEFDDCRVYLNGKQVYTYAGQSLCSYAPMKDWWLGMKTFDYTTGMKGSIIQLLRISGKYASRQELLRLGTTVEKAESLCYNFVEGGGTILYDSLGSSPEATLFDQKGVCWGNRSGINGHNLMYGAVEQNGVMIPCKADHKFRRNGTLATNLEEVNKYGRTFLRVEQEEYIVVTDILDELMEPIQDELNENITGELKYSNNPEFY